MKKEKGKMKKGPRTPARRAVGFLNCAFVLVTLASCITVRPSEPPVGMPVIADDPRVRVARVAEGEAAPFAGVLVNEWTWERIVAALQMQNEKGRIQKQGCGRGSWPLFELCIFPCELTHE